MKTQRRTVTRILPILLIGGLIAFPSDAFTAATDAALLWWSRILPTLLPYLIAVSLLCKSGILLRIPKRILPFALFGFGALGGYPIGAKLARTLTEHGILTRKEAERVAICCDLPNPVFLISVVSIGFFGSIRCAAPLLIGIYVSALLFSLPLLRLPYRRVSDGASGLRSGDLPDAIAEGVRSVGMIGGCLVLASVLDSLSNAVGIPSLLHRLTGIPHAALRAVLSGLFEMTCGIRSAAGLSGSLPLRLALAAFFAQFGGLSVALQIRTQTPVRTAQYFLHRFSAALLSAVLTGLLAHVLIPESVVPTFASVPELRDNAIALFSVSLAAAVGLLFVFVFTARVSRKSRKNNARA